MGGEGGVPGQARKPGGELGRALLGLCWGPAGNAVGPPTQQMTYGQQQAARALHQSADEDPE